MKQRTPTFETPLDEVFEVPLLISNANTSTESMTGLVVLGHGRGGYGISSPFWLSTQGVSENTWTSNADMLYIRTGAAGAVKYIYIIREH